MGGCAASFPGRVVNHDGRVILWGDPVTRQSPGSTRRAGDLVGMEVSRWGGGSPGVCRFQIWAGSGLLCLLHSLVG